MDRIIADSIAMVIGTSSRIYAMIDLKTKMAILINFIMVNNVISVGDVKTMAKLSIGDSSIIVP